MARLLWRKQNLATYRIAELARNQLNATKQEKRSQAGLKLPSIALERLCTEGWDPEAWEEIGRAADAAARKDLGETYELIEIGPFATFDYLTKELAVEERLDAMIERSLKRLLLSRGLKSISPAATPSSTPKRLQNA